MVVKYNQTQKGIYVNSINRGTGLLQKTSSSFKYYFSLDDENYRLARANAKLLERLLNAGVDTTNVDSFLVENDNQKYTFQVAKAVNNTVSNHHNYITLDKGSDDGVTPHSGIITSQGVVGIVRVVSPKYSVAMSILHRQTRISANVKGSNFPGSLIWDQKENDPQLFKLTDIPKHADIAVGDTVQTSGFSAIFPEGVMLGTIQDIQLKSGKYSYDIDVGSNIDMTNIQYVHIVKNLQKKEIEELEAAIAEEDK